jgi:hypothetical protein
MSIYDKEVSSAATVPTKINIVVHVAAIMHPQDWLVVKSMLEYTQSMLDKHGKGNLLLNFKLARDQIVPNAYVFEVPHEFKSIKQSGEVNSALQESLDWINEAVSGNCKVIWCEVLMGELQAHIDQCPISEELRDFDVQSRISQLKSCIGFSEEANARRGYMKTMDDLKESNPLRYRAIIANQYLHRIGTERLRMDEAMMEATVMTKH